MFTQIKIAIIIAIALAVISGLWYIQFLQDEVRINQENAAKLAVAVEQQQAVLNHMKEDQAKIVAINADIRNKVSEQTQEVTSLRDRFDENKKGEARDFGSLAVKKPGLIENAVNRGTENALRCMEVASGAKLTEKELAATNAADINRECPSIANPNYKKETK